MDRKSLNVTLYEQRLEELQAEDLTAEEFESLKTELQQSLLADVDREMDPAIPVAPSTDWKTALGMALAVPLIALSLYSDWGFSLGASSEMTLAGDLRESMKEREKLPELMDRLAVQLEDQPENFDAWYLLGEINTNIGRYAEATEAFRYLSEHFKLNSDLATYHAETLFMAEGRKVTGKVRLAIDRALELNPHEITMLEILGMDAYRSGDAKQAIELFNRALATKPGGKRAVMLNQTIQRIEKEMGLVSTVDEELSIEIFVELAPGLDLPGDSTVFVFARAFEGPKMPLAITRFKVADLPIKVRLSESMSMMAGMSLRDFDRVEVVARISAKGTVDTTPDDFQAISPVFELAGAKPGMRLMIKNRVRDQI